MRIDDSIRVALDAAAHEVIPPAPDAEAILRTSARRQRRQHVGVALGVAALLGGIMAVGAGLRDSGPEPATPQPRPQDSVWMDEDGIHLDGQTIDGTPAASALTLVGDGVVYSDVHDNLWYREPGFALNLDQHVPFGAVADPESGVIAWIRGYQVEHSGTSGDWVDLDSADLVVYDTRDRLLVATVDLPAYAYVVTRLRVTTTLASQQVPVLSVQDGVVWLEANQRLYRYAWAEDRRLKPTGELLGDVVDRAGTTLITASDSGSTLELRTAEATHELSSDWDKATLNALGSLAFAVIDGEGRVADTETGDQLTVDVDGETVVAGGWSTRADLTLVTRTGEGTAGRIWTCSGVGGDCLALRAVPDITTVTLPDGTQES